MLTRRFFSRSTVEVAQALLGCRLVSQIDGVTTAGLIVETEAYLFGNDSACHANKARTARTEVMFGPAGFAYVYPIHAKHCFNIVTERPEVGCAVLIRALEPNAGIEQMKQRRGVDDLRRLTTGPACLCQSLGIDREVNGRDLSGLNSEVYVQTRNRRFRSKFEIKSSPRIGVTSAIDRPLRFYLAGNPFVSGKLKLRH
ncbi:MAG: DNA-3-methyladenine glycosylase [Planctomycetota bacterium]